MKTELVKTCVFLPYLNIDIITDIVRNNLIKWFFQYPTDLWTSPSSPLINLCTSLFPIEYLDSSTFCTNVINEP